LQHAKTLQIGTHALDPSGELYVQGPVHTR
jgi:hypothetical protein